MKRRDFFKLSLFTAYILVSTNINAKTTKNSDDKLKTSILILGGGFAGLSTAKFLKELNPNLDVTLIEKNTHFISCPFSNAWLGGLKDVSFESLNFDYNSSVLKYKYNFLNETIVSLDTKNKQVITNKKVVAYDYLVMTLGIDYNYKKIFKKDKQKIIQAKLNAPAGLKPGSELIKLKRMITNFKDGNFVLTLPKSTYKCPPAPYERACMIANYFKEKYFTKELSYEELSIIPPNRANNLYKKSGIKTYAQGWVKLEKPTFRTVIDDSIYVIGDAQGEYPYPKSAQMANSCAYVLALELTTRIKNEIFNYKDNLPGNICYSIIEPNKAAWVSHEYKYKEKLEVNVNLSDISKDSFESASA